MNRIKLMNALSEQIVTCKASCDWAGAEIFTAAWLRLHREQVDARRIAAERAATPLDDRITIPIVRVGR